MLQHSKATEVELTAQGTGGELEIRYADNGKGFDTAKAREKKEIGGNGLRNMEDRAKQIGYKFELQSSPGAGTKIRIYS
jgi:signal transduction histidine kinase